MNRITQLFDRKPNGILSVYYTAGFPNPDDTLPVLTALQESGVDLVEIGMPFSDPVADGETIQKSSQQALDNGMTLNRLFEQLSEMRKTITVPVLLMGYLNPVLQHGVEAFCRKCQAVGVDGLILPDLPLDVYEAEFREVFEQHGLLNIFLITPQTSEDRIHRIDERSEGFIYMVSSAGVTGAKTDISTSQETYFERIASMNLKNPRLVGFGISNQETFRKANEYAGGAIIGSAFVKMLNGSTALSQDIYQFVKTVKGI